MLRKSALILVLCTLVTSLSLETKAKESASAEPIDSDNDSKPSFSGNASWYGIPFHGRKTANGEVFNMYKHSAAHLKLPLPSKVLIEDPRTGNVVIVRVNDRGPYAKSRVLDLSREAARNLGTLSRGVFYIDATVLESPIKKKP